MRTRWMVLWTVLVAALIAAGVTFASIKLPQADQWPSRPVTMVVPFAAGGPTDVVGRILADRLSDVLGQQVIVENIGGAGGMNGAQRVALANPDGYQALLGTVGTQVYNQTLYKKPLYNAVDDFAPVVLIGLAGSGRRPHQLPLRRGLNRAAPDQSRNGQAARGARAPQSRSAAAGANGAGAGVGRLRGE
jgi:hypothetical protein